MRLLAVLLCAAAVAVALDPTAAFDGTAVGGAIAAPAAVTSAPACDVPADAWREATATCCCPLRRGASACGAGVFIAAFSAATAVAALRPAAAGLDALMLTERRSNPAELGDAGVPLAACDDGVPDGRCPNEPPLCCTCSGGGGGGGGCVEVLPTPELTTTEAALLFATSCRLCCCCCCC